MKGLLEWILLSVGMAAAGVGVLAFVFNPLLTLLILGAVILASWVMQPAGRWPHRGS